MAPATKRGHFQRPPGRLSGFRRQRRHKKWRPQRAPTSPARTVSQPIGKPFYGQAKGLLWLTWRSYAGPPQSIYLPRARALNPSGRRQPVPDRTLGAQGRQARRRHQPSRRSRVNLREYRKAPPRSCSRSQSRPRRRRLNPQAPKGLVPSPYPVIPLFYSIFHTYTQ